MESIRSEGEVVTVSGELRTLTYRPRRVTLSDGTFLMHESRGGTLSSVWAADLGNLFVEVVHLGHGPQGGELVLVVPYADVVAVGDLVPPPTTETDTDANPAGVSASWAGALDLVLGLMGPDTSVLTSSGTVTRDDVDAAHQRLLGILNA